MKIKNKLYWVLPPLILAPVIISPIVSSTRDDNTLATKSAATGSTTTKPTTPVPSKETTIKEGKQFIYLTDNEYKNQYEMDYTANVNNPNFSGLHLLYEYFEKKYNEIFNNFPGWTKENKIKLVILKNGTNARVRFQGYDSTGELTMLEKDFKIIFSQPSIEKVVIKIRTVLESYKNNWPPTWSNIIINQFFSQLSQGIGNAIHLNPDSFPTVIYTANESNPLSPPINYDKTKIHFNNNSIEIEPNAISLIPTDLISNPDVRPINISVPLSIDKPTTVSFLEKNGWIIVVLPTGILAFIFLLIMTLIFSKKKMKKVDGVDPSWGFY